VKVTPSMLAKDVQPSRLERAAQKIADLVEARRGARHALVAYSGSAHLVMPFTSDAKVIASFAAELEPGVMPQEGDAAAGAVALAAQQLETLGRPGSILLIGDSIAQGQVDALAARRSSAPVSIYAVAAGPEVTPPADSPPAPALDRNAMQEAAKSAGGGLTVVTPDGSDIDRLTRELARGYLPTDGETPGTVRERRRDGGYSLLPLLALLLLTWFRRGWVIAYE